MSFNLGKKKGIKEKMEEMGYQYVRGMDFVRKSNFSCIKIEYVEIIETMKDGNADTFGVIAGSVCDSERQEQGVKVWLYIPNVDYADLFNCDDEDLKELVNGKYYYFIESEESKKGIEYLVGTLKN